MTGMAVQETVSSDQGTGEGIGVVTITGDTSTGPGTIVHGVFSFDLPLLADIPNNNVAHQPVAGLFALRHESGHFRHTVRQRMLSLATEL